MSKYVIGESREDYLEAILIVQNQQEKCRAIDLAIFLGFTKASVSVALKKLIENEDIQRDSSGYITLTPKGYEVAKHTYEKHKFFKEFLMEVGIDSEKAEMEACELEHLVSDITYKKLLSWYKKRSNS